MTPTGDVFTGMRADLLDVFPPGSNAKFPTHGSLGAWFEGGVYNVTTTTKNEILFEAAEDDIASVLLTEIELFTDQCFEQLQEVGCFCYDTRARSDAWNVVTLYYFGFFAAQTFLRLVGQPSLFLEKSIITRFQKMAGGSESPGAGAFYMQRVGPIGINRVQYRLLKSKQKIHESSWKSIFTYINKKLTGAVTTPQETLFYSNLTPKSLSRYYHEFDWPPQIRARANYHVGYAYLLVSQTSKANTKSLFNRWAGLDEGKLARLLTASNKKTNASHTDEFDIHVQFLFDLSLTIFLISRNLYGELIQRRRIDKRWEERRHRFREKMIFDIETHAGMIPTIRG